MTDDAQVIVDNSDQGCPVRADEARPDFDPKRRMWFHLHWSDRERFPEVEAENARLRAALETIHDATLARSGVAGIADICKEALS